MNPTHCLFFLSLPFHSLFLLTGPSGLASSSSFLWFALFLALGLLLLGFLLFQSRRKLSNYSAMIRKKEAEINRQVQLKQQVQQQLDLHSFLLSGQERILREPIDRMKRHIRHLSEDGISKHQLQESIVTLERNRFFVDSFLKDVTALSGKEEKWISSGERDFDLHRLLKEIHAEALREKNELNRPRVRVKLYPEVLADSFIIHSNPYIIRHVLMILVNHSLRYTYQGFLNIGYQRKEKNLLFSVENTGIGFTSNEYDHFFTYLRNGLTPGNFSAATANMDLVVAGELTRRMIGQLWSELSEDSSIRFMVKLPFTPPALTSESPQPQSGGSYKEKSRSYQWKGKKILVVEDSRMAFDLIVKMLENTGAKFVIEPDGIKALNRCKNDSSIDLVLMDIQLPFMDGYDATREIKKIRPELPVIAQTANALSKDREKARQAGCDDYLSKPIDADEMGAKVQAFLFPLG